MAHPDTPSRPARKAPVTLNPDTWTQLIEDRRAGRTLSEVSAHYGVHPSTITARFRRLGLTFETPAPPALGAPAAPVRADRAPVTTLEEAANLAIAEILSAINDNRDQDLLRFARIAAIVDKLKRGSRRNRRNPPPTNSPSSSPSATCSSCWRNMV